MNKEIMNLLSKYAHILRQVNLVLFVQHFSKLSKMDYCGCRLEKLELKTNEHRSWKKNAAFSYNSELIWSETKYW